MAPIWLVPPPLYVAGGACAPAGEVAAPAAGEEEEIWFGAGV